LASIFVVFSPSLTSGIRTFFILLANFNF
jgi:hypothetical protein